MTSDCSKDMVDRKGAAATWMARNVYIESEVVISANAKMEVVRLKSVRRGLARNLRIAQRGIAQLEAFLEGKGADAVQKVPEGGSAKSDQGLQSRRAKVWSEASSDYSILLAQPQVDGSESQKRTSELISATDTTPTADAQINTECAPIEMPDGPANTALCSRAVYNKNADSDLAE